MHIILINVKSKIFPWTISWECRVWQMRNVSICFRTAILIKAIKRRDSWLLLSFICRLVLALLHFLLSRLWSLVSLDVQIWILHGVIYVSKTLWQLDRLLHVRLSFVPFPDRCLHLLDDFNLLSRSFALNYVNQRINEFLILCFLASTGLSP